VSVYFNFDQYDEFSQWSKNRVTKIYLFPLLYNLVGLTSWSHGLFFLWITLRLREFRGLAPKSYLGVAGFSKSPTMVIILPSPLPSMPSPLPPLSNIKM
jgi:hypothetical protein